MDFATILKIGTYAFSGFALLDGAIAVVAQAQGQGANLDWLGNGTTPLVVGTLGFVFSQLVQRWLKLEQIKQERDALREARDAKIKSLQSNVETLTLILACARAELHVWKEHCPSQPPMRLIRAAQTRARKNPAEFVGDDALDDPT